MIIVVKVGKVKRRVFMWCGIEGSIECYGGMEVAFVLEGWIGESFLLEDDWISKEKYNLKDKVRRGGYFRMRELYG